MLMAPPSRLESLRKILRREKVDSILVTEATNVSYLSGFTGDSTYLYLTRNKSILISDSRYEAQLQQESPGFELEIRDAKSTTLAVSCHVIQSSGSKSVAIESESVTKATYDSLTAELQTVSWVSSAGWVEELRSIKDKEEVAAIRRSIAVNERAFLALRARLMGHQTEKHIAYELEHTMRQLGASQAAFKPIIAVGPRSALPHAVVTDQAIAESPFVLVDWGAMVDGYASDLTRVLITGKTPAKLRKIYEVVLAAQQSAIDRIRPGVPLKEIDRAARSVIESSGYGKYFGHGTGHGFGLQIHERPFLSPIREGELKADMVVTVEPGIYLPGFGGVRIEDDILVTRDGCEVLSTLPKQFDENQVPLI